MIKVYNPNPSVVTYKEESSGRTYSIQPFSWGFVPDEAAEYFMMAPGVNVVVPELEKTESEADVRDMTPPETGENGEPEPDIDEPDSESETLPEPDSESESGEVEEPFKEMS